MVGQKPDVLVENKGDGNFATSFLLGETNRFRDLSPFLKLRNIVPIRTACY